jgi:hypothetical protein
VFHKTLFSSEKIGRLEINLETECELEESMVITNEKNEPMG